MTDKYGHNKIKCSCKDCGMGMLRRTDSFKTWSGRCVSCAKKYRKENAKGRTKKRVEVECKKCGSKWQKRTDMLDKWKGYCFDCSHELKHSTELQKEKCRLNLKRQRVLNPEKYRVVPKKRDKHWNWQGGKTSIHMAIRQSLEYKQWRTSVFTRDGFKCVVCGCGGQLVADHIKPFHLFPDGRIDVDNGRTLCKKCDKEYGYNYFRDKAKVVNMIGKIDKTVLWKDVAVQ